MALMFIYLDCRRTAGGKKAVSVSGTKLWNSIPMNIRNSNTIVTFKSHMCCHRWNNIKWSSSKKWCTPRISVRAPPIPNTYIWYKLWNNGLNSIMLCQWYSNPSRNKWWRGHTDATKWFTYAVQMGRYNHTNNMKFNANKF